MGSCMEYWKISVNCREGGGEGLCVKGLGMVERRSAGRGGEGGGG